jgi:hypothetical protein
MLGYQAPYCIAVFILEMQVLPPHSQFVGTSDRRLSMYSTLCNNIFIWTSINQYFAALLYLRKINRSFNANCGLTANKSNLLPVFVDPYPVGSGNICISGFGSVIKPPVRIRSKNMFFNANYIAFDDLKNNNYCIYSSRIDIDVF